MSVIQNKLTFGFITSTIILILIEVALRLLGMKSGFEYYLKVTPSNVFAEDSILAWKLNKGTYKF